MDSCDATTLLAKSCTYVLLLQFTLNAVKHTLEAPLRVIMFEQELKNSTIT